MHAGLLTAGMRWLRQSKGAAIHHMHARSVASRDGQSPSSHSHDDAFGGLSPALVLLEELELAVVDGPSASFTDEGDAVERGHAVFDERDCNEDRCSDEM